MSEPLLILYWDRQRMEFATTPVSFSAHWVSNVFARMNSLSLGEAILRPPYAKLAPLVRAEYGTFLSQGLGHFLVDLKTLGDPFYLRFLNTYGDQAFCRFQLTDRSVRNLRGLYCFTLDDTVKYIGRTIDSFAKRINQGYGSISPRNCYRDGRRTNCHLNALTSGVTEQVQLYLHPMVDEALIVATERALIGAYKPEWNVQLKVAERLDS